MSLKNKDSQLINITETVLRLYVLLAKCLERSHDKTSQTAFPDSEFQSHLKDTQDKVKQLIATNQIVKGKVEEEYKRIIKLATEGSKYDINQDREVLQTKILALSDLLAVFRSV